MFNFSFFVFLFYNILNLTLIHSQSICIWGAAAIQPWANGVYTQSGTNNGQPYFTKTQPGGCPDATLYLTYVDIGGVNNWVISSEVNPTLVFFYTCTLENNPSFATNPSECDNHWVYNNGTGYPLNNNLYAIAGNTCPSFNCPQINVLYPSFNKGISTLCHGIYDLKIGPNMYQKSYVTPARYFYFNYLLGRWLCFSENTIDCTATYSDRSGFYNYKTDLQIEQSISLYMEQSMQTIDLYCMVSTHPSIYPTYNPTTTTTTLSPTVTTSAPTAPIPTTGAPTDLTNSPTLITNAPSPIPTVDTMNPTTAQPTVSTTAQPTNPQTTNAQGSTSTSASQPTDACNSPVCDLTNSNTNNNRCDYPNDKILQPPNANWLWLSSKGFCYVCTSLNLIFSQSNICNMMDCFANAFEKLQTETLILSSIKDRVVKFGNLTLIKNYDAIKSDCSNSNENFYVSYDVRSWFSKASYLDDTINAAKQIPIANQVYKIEYLLNQCYTANGNLFMNVKCDPNIAWVKQQIDAANNRNYHYFAIMFGVIMVVLSLWQ